MKPNTPIIEAVGPDRVLHIVQSMVKCRSQLDLEAQRTLDESVLEFIGRNPLALATLMLDQTLPDSHPGVVEAMLRRAFDLASELGRERVEKHAREAGYFDLFGQAKAREEPFLTKSQRAGLDRMLGLAKLHFKGAVRYGVKLRTWPLLVGPSGVGKSNLARRLSAELGLPLMKLTYGEWLISGARTDTPTLQRLRMEVEKHDRMVLFIDEVEKIGRGEADGWTRCLQTELFGVLDGQLAAAEGARSGWTPALLRKLRERVFICSAGTWMDLWQDHAKRGVGFGGTAPSSDITDCIRRARVLPPELLNRHHADWVILEPYTHRDFEEIAAGLKLPVGVLDPVAAAESGLNFRFVEGALATHALKEMGGEF